MEKSYPTEAKKLLDNLRRYPYHSIEAIYLSSQSLQWINDKKLRVFGVSLFKFSHYVHLTSFKTSGFYLYKLKRAYKSFRQYRTSNRQGRI